MHLAPDAVVTIDEGAAVLEGPSGRVRLGDEAELAGLAETLQGPGITVPKRIAAPLEFLIGVDRGLRQGLLHCSLLWAGEPMATRVMLSPLFAARAIHTGTPRVLSRFVCCRARGAKLVLESPRSHAEVVLHDHRCAALLFGLAGGETLSDFADLGEALTCFLEESGFVVPPDSEDNDPALAGWEFHDLYFHSRTRIGRHANPSGAVDRGLVPPPLFKSATATDVIELEVPDLESLATTGPSFSVVLERRRSLRESREQPLTVAQLGEFLYRAARVQGIEEGRSSRPSPSGGARHELEIYLAVDSCQGLEYGFYRYLPECHQLERLYASVLSLEALIIGAARRQGDADRPAVLILLAARFSRVSSRYASIAYALILKDVGCLFQTMYLVATAMGLAPCAIGTGDSDLFARATGLAYEAEGLVGELTLR